MSDPQSSLLVGVCISLFHLLPVPVIGKLVLSTLCFSALIFVSKIMEGKDYVFEVWKELPEVD